MKFLLRILTVVMVMPMVMAAFGAETYYTLTLNSNGGTINPDYIDKLCEYRNSTTNVIKWYKPANGASCITNNPSLYTISSSDLRLSGTELPQKKACSTPNCSYEDFLGYHNRNVRSGDGISSYEIVPKENGTFGFYNPISYTLSNTMNARWQGVDNQTELNITYKSNNGLEQTETRTCVYGQDSSPGCEILAADTFTAPAGKYFDGWRCYSNSHNCRIARYLPNNYATLNPAITPYIASSNSVYSDAIDNVIPSSLATAYTGKNSISLIASWAPYEITFYCEPSASSPFVGNTTTTLNQYIGTDNQLHDIVYGSIIPLDKNFGQACKSPYYAYDSSRGNEIWCPEYIGQRSDIRIQSYTVYGTDGHYYIDWYQVPSSNKNITFLNVFNTRIGVQATCLTGTIFYNCGNFIEVNGAVAGIAPERYHSERYDSGTQTWTVSPNDSYYKRSWSVTERNRPLPAKPFPDGGVECATTTLPHTGHQFYQVTTGTDTSTGNGCCVPPKYGDHAGDTDKTAVFKGWKATSAVGTLTANGWVANSENPTPRLLQPNEYGRGSPATNGNTNCDLSTMNNDIDPDNWNPGAGCNLWPWTRNVTLTAVWDYAPINVTLVNSSVSNPGAVLSNVWLDYDTGFYLENTFETSINALAQSQIPTRTEPGDFLGYYWCPGNLETCANPVQVINANGNFTNNYTFTKVDAQIWPKWREAYECDPGYYLPASEDDCEICTLNNYCEGGLFYYDANNDQGITACPAGLLSPVGMWEIDQCGHILHFGSYHVYLRSNTPMTTPSLRVQMGQDTFYGNMYSILNGAGGHLHVSYNNQTYVVCDESGDSCTGID